MKLGAVACAVIAAVAVAMLGAVGACDGEIQLGAVSSDGAVSPDAPGDSAPPIVFGRCGADSECLSTLRCDVAHAACVECRVDTDCTSEAKVCLQPAARCVGCRADTDCEGGQRCEVTTHTCVERCSAGKACSLGTCEIATGRCVECTPGASCDENRVCAPTSKCVTCTGDAECSGDQPHCDMILARCVACTSDAHCVAPKRCDSRSGECRSSSGK